MRFFFIVLLVTCAAGLCPPFNPVCRLNCAACDRNPNLLVLPDLAYANFTAREAGLYSVRVAGQSRCGWSAGNVTVNALCSDPVPAAVILQPTQPASCASQYFVQNTISLLGDGYLSSGLNSSLEFCWCVAVAPPRSQATVVVPQGNTARNATFTPDVPGEYWIRLTVRNGCSPTYAHLYLNVSCSCAPVASAGTTPTATYNGLMPAKTNTMALQGSYTYSAEGSKVPVSYMWNLVSWSGGGGWNMSMAINGPNLIYNFYPVVVAGPSSTTRTLLSGPTQGTVTQNSTSSYSFGVTDTTYPAIEFSRQTTSMYVYKTITTRVVDEISTVRQVSVNPTSFSQCTVTIFNYTSSTAAFQAEPYYRCLGQHTLQLTASSQCGSTSDTETISVVCGARPRAELSCAQLSRFNNTLRTFENVTVDGRGSTPGLTYTWRIVPATAALLTPRIGEPRVADVQPLVAGVFTVELWVDDAPNGACAPSIGRVNITAGCVRGAPSLTVSTVQQPTNFQGSSFQTPAIVEVRMTGYTGNLTDLSFSWSLALANSVLPPVWQAFPQISSLPYNLTVPLTSAGQYVLTVMATDSCVSVTQTTTFTASCAQGNSPNTITSNLAFARCVWDFQSAMFQISANASASTVLPGRTARFTWSSTANTAVNALLVPVTSGDFTVNLASPPPAGPFTVTVAVGDGCSIATPITSAQITCSCPQTTNPFSTATVTPNIQLAYVPSFNSTNYFGIYQSATISLRLAVANPIVNIGDTLTWSFGAGSTSNGLGMLNSTAGLGPVQFTPTSSGTFFIVATWRNNCSVTYTQTFTVNVACPTWAVTTGTAMLRGGANNVGAAIPANGVPFEGPNSRYSEVMFKYTPTDALSHPPIYYSWFVLSSPPNSQWGFTRNNYFVASAVSSTVIASNSLQFTLNTTLNETLSVVNRTTYISQVATLPEHGGAHMQGKNALDFANFAQTCLRPDVPGSYSVQLTMTDGCSTNTVVYPFTVAPCPLSLTLTKSPNAITGKRVVITVVPSVTDTPISYSAVLVQQPCTSTISTGTMLTNGQGNIASFIPDAPGTYIVQVSANSICNTASSNITVEVACDTSRFGTAMQPCAYPPVTQVSYVTNIFPYNLTVIGNQGGFPAAQLSAYNVLPSALQCSKYGTFNWNQIGYSCPLTYIPPIPPPPPPSTCMPKVFYSWVVLKAPCNSTFAPRTNTSTHFLSNELSFQFTPDVGGNYTLLFTATDGCSTANKTVQVITKCPYKFTITAQNSIVTAGICGAAGPEVNAVDLYTATGVNITSTTPPANLRVNAYESTCPVPQKYVNTTQTCGDKACVCNLAPCQKSLYCACAGSCCCEGDPCETTGGGGFTPPFTSSSSNAVNAQNNNGLPPVTSGGVNVTTSGSNSNVTNTPGTNGGSNTVNGGSSNTGSNTNVTNAATPPPGFGPEDANSLSDEQYQLELEAARARYEKYLTAIWAGAMTPISTGLAASVAYNAFTVVKYKSLLFGQGMGGGGVEMSTAPVRPLV